MGAGLTAVVADFADLEAAVVRVSAGPVDGTGFFVDRGLIATCAHVVPARTALIELADGRTIEGTVVSRAPEESREGFWPPPDLALVEVGVEEHPVLDLARSRPQTGNGLLAAGFTIGPDEEPTLTYERPTITATEPVDGIRVLKLNGCQLEPGMSGAPLLDPQTWQVVGIVKRSRGVESAVGGWAIPVGLLDDQFPHMFDAIRARRLDRLRDAYCAEIIKRNETVEPRGMRRSRDSQDIVFPLDDVYLSLEMQRYHEADLTASAGRSPTAAAIEPLLGVERIPDVPQMGEEASLARILSDGRLTVLLGGPGSGKTTLLQWVALHAARACAEGRSAITVEARQVDPDSTSEEPVEVTAARLPIAVRLADFHERLLAEREAGRELALMEYLVDVASGVANDRSGDLGRYLERLIVSGEAIILLDGMDELREMSHREEVRDAIAAFVSQVNPADPEMESPGLLSILAPLEGRKRPTVLVTSRHAGYRDSALPTKFFEHGVIAPLSDGAVRRFLLNWNVAVRRWARGEELGEADLLTDAIARADAIDAALHASPSMRAIARTPLLLTVITLVHDELGRLPHHRADLLMEMGRILVERRATERSFLDAADILGPVALWLHERRATGLLTKGEFNELVRQSFPRLVVHEPDGATVRVMSERFCVDAEEQFGLIVERGTGLVGFQHRMLQEFFAALEIASWCEDSFEALEERIFDPQWREVVIFVACLEAKTSAQRGRTFMARLLTAGSAGIAEAERARQALLLAADCLAEIERTLPQTELEVLRGLVELVCDWSSALPATEISEAMSRLRSIAPLFEETTDLVLTRAFRDASVPVRRALCEIVVPLGIQAPGLRTLLERRDGGAGVCLAERTALLGLREEAREEQRPERSGDVPEWVTHVHAHLDSFGASEPRRALDAMDDSPVADAEGAMQLYCKALAALLQSAVGVDASLAGIAMTVARPEALPQAYAKLVERQLFVEASDLLIWSARNMRLSADTLDRWGELDPEYRDYVLALLVREPARWGAQDIAWAELERAAGDESDETPAGVSFSLLCAMQILSTGQQANLSLGRFRSLDEIARRDPEVGSTVAFVLSGATLAEAVTIEELQPRSEPARSFAAVTAASRGELTAAALAEVVRASEDPTGVWRARTTQALSHSWNFSNLDADVVASLEDTGDAELSPRTQLALDHFAGFTVMDDLDGVSRLLRGELSPTLFGCATPQIDHRLAELALGEEDGREHVVSALNGRRNRGGAKGLPPLDPRSPALARLLLSHSEADGTLAGALLARAALESPDAASDALDVFDRGNLTEVAALEFALWASEYGAFSRHRLEQAASRAGTRWSGRSGVAIAARLLAASPDNGRRALAAIGSGAELIDGLLQAGDHPVVWSTRVDSTPMRGLSALIAGLSAEVDAFEMIVAACAEALHEGCDWPRARFALHQLMELGARAPDALETQAGKYDLAVAATPYLASRLSFSVRARAFAVLARAGHLSEDMFQALVSGALDINDVSNHVFESLRFIRSVDDEVIARIGASLRSNGVEAIAALDVALQLLHSYALDEDPRRRVELVDSLVLAACSLSEWAVCRLPSGLGLSLLPSMMGATRQALSNAVDAASIRPIMLTRPPASSRVQGKVDPSLSFTENFLVRARQYLEEERGHAAG